MNNPPRMGTKALAIRGVAFNGIGRACSFLITFFLTPFLVHRLGDESYGLWSIVMALTGYYALADLGLRGAGTKYIAEAYALNDRDRINRIVVTAISVYTVLASIILLIVACTAWVFPILFETGGESVTTVRWVVLITGTCFAIRLIGQPFASTLQALMRFNLANMLGVGSQVLHTSLIVAAVVSGNGLLGMAYGTLAAAIVTQTVQFLLARKVLCGISLSASMFSRSKMKELISFGSELFAISGLWRLSEASGIFIVGVLLGPASAAYYSIAESVSRKTARLSRSVSTVLMPVASQLNAKNRKYELTQLLVLVPRLFLTMALLVTIVFVFMGRSFIDLWLGAGYSGQVYPLICILCLAIAARQVAGGLPSILQGMGQIRTLIWVRGLEFVLIVGLGILFCYLFDLLGIAWTTFCVRAMAAVWITAITCKELGYPYVRFVRETFFPAVFATFPSLAAAYAVVSFFPTNQLYVLIGQMLSVGLIGVLSAFIVCVPASLRQSIVSAFWPQKSSATPIPGDHLTHGPYD